MLCLYILTEIKNNCRGRSRKWCIKLIIVTLSWGHFLSYSCLFVGGPLVLGVSHWISTAILYDLHWLNPWIQTVKGYGDFQLRLGLVSLTKHYSRVNCMIVLFSFYDGGSFLLLTYEMKAIQAFQAQRDQVFKTLSYYSFAVTILRKTPVGPILTSGVFVSMVSLCLLRTQGDPVRIRHSHSPRSYRQYRRSQCSDGERSVLSEVK